MDSTPNTIQNKYYNCLSDFNKSYVNVVNNCLNVVQWNIRGINDFEKFDELIYVVNECKMDLDVIVVGETMMKKENSGIYNIPGYRAFFSCRENSAGGLAVFVKLSLAHKIINIKTIEGLHYIHLELKLRGHTYNIIGIYRPPSFDYSEFQNIMEGWLSAATQSKPFLIIGDVNVPINLQNNNVVIRYKNLLESYGYVCTNTFATRPSSNNILDHFICPIDHAAKLQNHTIFHEISDHLPIISSIFLGNEKKQQELKMNIVDHTKLHTLFAAFLNEFQIIDDAETSLNTLVETYNRLITECTRSISKTVHLKGDHCPWMTYSLWRLIQIKNNYLAKSKNAPNDVHIREMLTHISKKVKTAKIRCKREYYENILKSSSHSNVWKVLNEVFGRSKITEKINLKVDGTVLHSDSDVVEVFNNFFSSVGNDLADKLPKNDFDALRHVHTVNNSIFLRPTNESEVCILINQLNVKKSRGHDNLSADLLKAHLRPFSEIITKLFNSVIVTGMYPNILKIAKVTPIFKSGDPHDPSNYRPISTLSVLNKIFEQLLTKRLSNFFAENNVLYNFQYGFREGCGTSNAIVELVDDLISELDRKKIVGGLFIDLKKAFDTINHEILLNKLDRYGIRGIANDLIKSYLSNRKQFVVLNGVRSSLCSIDIGVPQGSNIGPLLFLIFINDLGNLKLRGTPRLFADDTALFYPHSNTQSIIKDIESDLENLLEYFNGNRLSLNLLKTKYMIFHSPRKKIQQHSDPCFRNIQIEKVSTFKYLGLHLDSCLLWDAHIKKVSSKISSLCGLMKRVRPFVPDDALLRFYYACIHSIIQYLIIVWGHAAKSKLKKIQTLQNRCVKVIFSLPHLYSTVLLYSSSRHKIIPIMGLRDSQTIMYVHNTLYNRSFHHNIVFSARSAVQHTRHANELLRSKASTNMGLVRIQNYGPSKFNTLPNDLKIIQNSLFFKSNLKQYITRNLNEYLL